MAETAAHLVERVLPEVPVRQWVLTLSYPLRYRCAWDARLTSEVLRAFLRALFADLRRRGRAQRDVERGRCGAVTFIQRFGSALNLAPHFHSLILDDVYAGPAHTPRRFMPLPPPTTQDVARVMAGTARRVMRLLERRGLESAADPLSEDDPLLATLMRASVLSRIATGPEASQPWRPGGTGRARRGRCGPQGGRASAERTARLDGMPLEMTDAELAYPLAGGGNPAESVAAHSRPRHRWAEVLQRIFEVDALRCPRCGERMRILAAITNPDVARRILCCLGLPPRAPPLAVVPDCGAIDDPWLDASESFDFDQTAGRAWDPGA